MTDHYLPLTRCHDDGCQRCYACERWLTRLALGGHHAMTLRPPGDSGAGCEYFLERTCQRFATTNPTESLR